MKSFDLVIFDCDGVLVDSEIITNELMISLLRPYGLIMTRNEYVNSYVGIKLEDCINQISAEFNITLADSFLMDYHKQAAILLKQNVQEVEGVRKLIERLKVPFCVASNSHEDKVKMMLDKTGLIKYFDGKIFSSTHVSHPKPAPDVYLLAAHTNQVKPENCAVIEDTPTGIRAGKAAGMTVYGFEGLFPAEILLQSGADVTFDHMDQIFITECTL